MTGDRSSDGSTSGEQTAGAVPLPAAETTTVAIGFPDNRDRELLIETLSAYQVESLDGSVPAGTDVCVVSTDQFREHREALRAWKEREQPAMAPVLLLVTEEVPDPWSRYREALGHTLDSIQTIPASKREIVATVDGLVAVRQHSLIAAKRWERLELYSRAMDNATIGISIADAQAEDLPLIYVNQGFIDLTGYSLPEVLDRNCRFLQGTETDEATVARLRSALDSEEPVSVVIRNYTKSGEPFWNQLDIVPVYDTDGTVTHFLGFQQDVTERKERQQLLEQYEHVFESVSDPIAVLDPQTTVLHANSAALEIFDCQLDRSDPVTLAEVLPDEAAAVVRRTCRIVVETGRSLERELTIEDTSGKRRVFQVKFERETVSETETDRVIAIARDISAVRTQQGQLSVLDRVLRHNLRNKLTVIGGRAEYIGSQSSDLDPERIAETAAGIESASAELLDIVQAIRQFHVGTEVDQPGLLIDVAALVRSAVEDFENSFETVDFEVETPDAAEAVSPTQLELCLQQLVEYAVDRTEDSAADIGLTVIDTERAPTVGIEVTLRGVEFTQMERDALAAGSESQLEHTQGIKLWLVKWAVENVGGGLRIENHDGDGRISIRLQRTRDEGDRSSRRPDR